MGQVAPVSLARPRRHRRPRAPRRLGGRWPTSPGHNGWVGGDPSGLGGTGRYGPRARQAEVPPRSPPSPSRPNSCFSWATGATPPRRLASVETSQGSGAGAVGSEARTRASARRTSFWACRAFDAPPLAQFNEGRGIRTERRRQEEPLVTRPASNLDQAPREVGNIEGPEGVPAQELVSHVTTSAGAAPLRSSNKASSPTALVAPTKVGQLPAIRDGGGRGR